MTLEKSEKELIINNKDTIIKIMERYISHLERVIRKERDPQRKSELSAVADEVEGWVSLIKNLKYIEPKEGDFTGI
jgi:hypothetical protein